MIPDLSAGAVLEADLTGFKKLLLHAFGHTFEHEREATLVAALGRRMSALNLARLDLYHDRLLSDCDELQRLIELLTVHETYFFREPEHLDLVIDLMPKLLSGRGERPIRILSAGCSTGEEPYSVAILLRERFGSHSERMFCITGVDIDANVIHVAKQAVYSERSFRGINKTLSSKYFQALENGKFKVNEAIARQVQFEIVNLLDSTYPQRMLAPDIILYRNVSIYFPCQIQQQIFKKLADILVDGGTLLVGASETMHHDLRILSLVKQGSLFIYRKNRVTGFQSARTAPGGSAAGLRQRLTPALPALATTEASDIDPILDKLGVRPHSSAGAALTDDSPEVIKTYNKALELAREHRSKESLAWLDKLLEQCPASAKAYILKGNLLLSESNFEQAVEVCNLALRQDIFCASIYLMLGMAARHLGDDTVALKRFREAIYLNSSCWLAHFFSAEIFYAEGDEKHALCAYEAAAKVLERLTAGQQPGEALPLAFKVDQFNVICRHKLSLLRRLSMK
ncbi:putative biofilm formation methyltransferase WspC [mine drainage metagenome]|uniref:protein-glutamate O-methyltransferase n=1 Tax=mine drainage metagenome TaxID=410659 RepID=A0A1J5Q2M3_9ZZZZ